MPKGLLRKLVGITVEDLTEARQLVDYHNTRQYANVTISVPREPLTLYQILTVALAQGLRDMAIAMHEDAANAEAAIMAERRYRSKNNIDDEEAHL